MCVGEDANKPIKPKKDLKYTKKKKSSLNAQIYKL